MERIIAKALEKDRDIRYQNASEIRADLKRLRRDSESGRVATVGSHPTPWFSARFARSVLAFAGVLLLLSAALSVRWLFTRRVLPRPEITQRRLTANPGENPVDYPVISPDGKYLAYSDDSGIHVKLIATGEMQTFSTPQTLTAGRDSWTPAAWFPDSTRLLANLVRSGTASIWSISILAGSSRLVRGQGWAWSVSHDGSTIAFTMPAILSAAAPVNEIWLMGPNGEEPHRLLAGDESTAFAKVVWQPDGDRLAYLKLHLISPEVWQSAIESRTRQEGQATIILTDPEGNVQDFAYLPNGRIVYSRSRTSVLGSESDLWEIDSDKLSGQPLATSSRVTSWPRIDFRALSASLNGSRLVFLEALSQSQIYIAEVAAGGTRLHSEPHLLTHAQASYLPTAWTADGKSVLFTSDINGSWDVYKQELNKEDPELLVSGPAFKTGVRLSSDGKWVLYTATDSTAPFAPNTQKYLLRAALSGGTPEVVGSVWDFWPIRCSRISCIFGEPSSDGKQFLFFELDPLKGKGQLLASTDDHHNINFDVSPDGSLIAWTKPGFIRFLSLQTRKSWDTKYPGSWFFLHFDWAADGKGFFVGTHPERGGASLLYLDLQGKIWPLWKTTYSDTWAAPSPDGRHLAILGGTQDRNVWMIENF
jgi:Tol biopolymer transport system component